jgi:nucleotide-binding universal stress UspA family protein
MSRTGPVLALDEGAAVRFGGVVAAMMGAPLLVADVHAGEDDITPLARAQMGEELPSAPPDAEEDDIALGAASAPRALDLAATELGAGLIVVGPGSTADRLLNGSPVAVAVVAGDWNANEPPESIAAGFVETREGHAAVRQAHALARRSGATLRVLSVVRGEAARPAAEEAAAAATPAEPGVRVDVDVVVGDPADVLLEASREAGLLVCGSRSYGPTPAVLLGSVTRRVTAGAGCPVVVLARGASPDPG